ncbi:MAG: hypothetical protein QOI41_2515 [Myxococcales bacterium]|nr:hypothetical protein [Myxococcales bacterium]
MLILGAASPARADDLTEARKHFAEGVKRYQDGDYEGARFLFQQANTEHHAAAIVYNIARAEERLGHPQAAVDAYDAYIAEAGEKGEFTQAAVLALARIRASAPQLHIETKPAGARVFVDGSPTRDPAPTRVLVPPGRHHIVAEGEGWHAEADIEATPSGPGTVMLVAPTDPNAPIAKLAPAAPPVEPARDVGATKPGVSDGFVLGVQFVVVPHDFIGTRSHEESSFGLSAGLLAEAGYALTDRLVLAGRGLVTVGSKGVPATVLMGVGIAMSYRVHDSVWIGGAFMGGRALLPGAFNPTGDEQRRFDSDYVFCPTLEISVAVLTKPYGQWLLSAYPGYFFASPTDNDVFYIPIGFGLRTF